MTLKQKQALLFYLGYYEGQLDGVWGQQSQKATEAFQRDYGLTVDGIFGVGTEKRIREVVASGEEAEERVQMDTPPEWWKEIRYFRWDEPYIACPCGRCGGFPAEPSQTLMRTADRIREHFGAPMIPTSTVRCQAHNDSLKGSAKNSCHLRGKAMDFVVSGHTAAQVVAYVQTLGVRYTYAIDNNAVHMDVN